jgi:hypothetical protein
MRHAVLCRLVALLAAAWTMATPLQATAAQEGPGSPGVTENPNPQPVTPADTPAPRPKRETYPFRGTVGSVDPAAMTLVLEGKQSKRIVQLTARTRIEKDGATTPLESVKAGDVVGGTLRKTPEGREEAILVRTVHPEVVGGSPPGGARRLRRFDVTANRARRSSSAPAPGRPEAD